MSEKTRIIEGKLVRYILSTQDIDAITESRRVRSSFLRQQGIPNPPWNEVFLGCVFPALAIRVWSDGENPPVNLQVFLDGEDSYWATSRHEGGLNDFGTWHLHKSESEPLFRMDDIVPHTHIE